MAVGGPPVTVVASGGWPVTYPGAHGYVPFTVVASGGMPVTLVTTPGAFPVTLLDTAGALYSVGPDVTGPVVVGVALISDAGVDQTYSLSDVVSARVTFDETVTVTGTPTLALNVGGVSRSATYASGSGTTQMVFNYTVQAGDTDTDGISINANSLALSGGTIKDAATNNATLTHSAVAANALHKVNTDVTPVLSSPTDTKTGSTTATLTVSTTGSDGTLYWVLSTSSTAPSAAQVKLGQMHTGAAAAKSGSQAVSGSGVQNVSATALTASTTYYAHFMHENAGAVQSNVASGDGFTTDAASSYSAEAELVFAAFTTPPVTGRKDAIDACIVALKTAGVWTKLDVLYLFAAADSQAAKINWKAPGTYDATAVNSPSFTADRGYTGNASSSYLTSNFNPVSAAGNYAQNSAHLGAWCLTHTGTNAASIGSINAGINAIVAPFAFSLFITAMNDGSSFNTASASAIGHFVASRTASNAMAQYKNGSSTGTASDASTGFVSANLFVMARSSSGTPDLMADNQHMAAHIGGALNSTEVTAIYNALNTYKTAVGA